MALKNRLKRSEKQFVPLSPRIPPPPSPTSDPPVYQIPFTIQEIDTIMSTLLELNVPVRTYILLDNKFGEIKRRSMGILSTHSEDNANGPGKTD